MIQRVGNERRVFVLFFILIALPALACSTLMGEDPETTQAPEAVQVGDDEATVSEEEGGSLPDQGDSGSSDGAVIGEDEEASETGEPGESDGIIDEVDSGSDESDAGATDGTGSSSAEGEASTETADSSSAGGDDGSSGAGAGPSGGAITEDPQETILEALSSGLSVDAMRLTIENRTEGQEILTVVEFVRPDRYRLVSEEIEIVIIGGATYLKGPDGQWLETPADMSSSVEPFVNAMIDENSVSQNMDELIGSIDEINYLGRENLNGVETLVYEYSQVTTGGEIDQYSKIWIGANDGRLYRQELSGSFGGDSIDSAIQYEYGPDIVIEPPV